MGAISKILQYRMTLMVLAGVGVVVIVGLLLALQPITRNIVAQDALCNACHLPEEYNPDFRLTASRPHLAIADQPQSQAECIDCHLPEGWLNSIYAYTHFVSFTDLFGYGRDLKAERAGDWIPPRAATAYRVRDKLFAADSSPCRTCHIEEEIVPKRARGVNAHKLALEEGQTCIECHTNLAHRMVEIRPTAFTKLIPDAEEPGSQSAGAENE